MPDTFLNVREAARRLDVHENTIRNWVRDGLLTDARVPGSSFIRLRLAEVEAMTADRHTAEVEAAMTAAREAIENLRATIARAETFQGSEAERAYGEQVVTVRSLVRILLAVLDGKSHETLRPRSSWDLAAHDAQVRAEHGERIAKAIEARRHDFAPVVSTNGAYLDAADIARSESEGER